MLSFRNTPLPLKSTTASPSYLAVCDAGGEVVGVHLGAAGGGVAVRGDGVAAGAGAARAGAAH